ncbi:MAG: hypothetical protein AAGA03_14200, partial [Planctomycetota bacterium]
IQRLMNAAAGLMVLPLMFHATAFAQGTLPAPAASAAAGAATAASGIATSASQSLSGAAAALPTAGASVVSAGGGLAVAPQAAPSMLQVLSSASKSFCTRLKTSPLGRLAAGMRKPLSLVTGGIVADEKPPNAEEKAQPGPEGTAAQIKAVKLQAPKRQAAIKELKGADVRYHPEVEANLITALRADPSECVRLEAATVIGTLPICTEALSKALEICATGSEADGNPAELSVRVQLRAEASLARCLCCLPQNSSTPTPRPEYPGITEAENPPESAARNTASGRSNQLPPLVMPVSAALSSSRGQHLTVDPATFRYSAVRSRSHTRSESTRTTPEPPASSTQTQPRTLTELFRQAANPK